MEKSIDKIVDALTKAFDLGAKQAQELYPMLKTQWMTYQILDIFVFIGFLITICALVVIFVMHLEHSDLEGRILIDTGDIEADEVKMEKYLKQGKITFVIAGSITLASLILEYIFASDYMIFMQILGN